MVADEAAPLLAMPELGAGDLKRVSISAKIGAFAVAMILGCVFAVTYSPNYNHAGALFPLSALGHADPAALGEGVFGVPPLVEGNDVTLVPVNNIPIGGFQDRHLDSILGYKAANMGIAKDQLTAREIIYFASAKITGVGQAQGVGMPCTVTVANAMTEAARAVLSDKVAFDHIRIAACKAAPRGAHEAELEVAIRRSTAPVKDPAAFARSVFAIVQSKRYLKELRTQGVELKGAAAVSEPYVRAMVLIEGPAGSADSLQTTNGPAGAVAVSTLEAAAVADA